MSSKRRLLSSSQLRLSRSVAEQSSFDYILVHTLQRTGGTSIASFLRSADLPCTILHVHCMAHPYRFSPPEQAHIDIVRRVRPERIGIVVCARDPIARNVSAFWRLWAPLIGDRLTENNITDWYYAHGMHWLQHEWYGSELVNVHRIDPFKQARRFRPPYMIFEHGRLLMLRLEDIAALPVAVSEWLDRDVTHLSVPHDERGDQHARIALTDAYVEAMYHPLGGNWVFPDWVYSADEIERFAEHWGER